MTDELTPEEKEAFDKLPRERMPAGLEARVVDAMRERGFLAGRRRTIVLTHSRVAGVLAACVALMIGAYAIGLHRGGADRMLPPAETARDVVREDGPPAAPEASAQALKPGETPEAGRTTPERARPQPQAPPSAVRPSEVWKEEPAVAGRTAEPKKESGAPAKGLATDERDADDAALEAPAPASALNESADRTRAMRDRAFSGVPGRPLTFFLNGSPVIVEAPDSVRVTPDQQGRLLLIYTSDGIIRIRLAEDP